MKKTVLPEVLAWLPDTHLKSLIPLLKGKFRAGASHFGAAVRGWALQVWFGVADAALSTTPYQPSRVPGPPAGHEPGQGDPRPRAGWAHLRGCGGWGEREGLTAADGDHEPRAGPAEGAKGRRGRHSGGAGPQGCPQVVPVSAWLRGAPPGTGCTSWGTKPRDEGPASSLSMPRLCPAVYLTQRERWWSEKSPRGHSHKTCSVTR